MYPFLLSLIILVVAQPGYHGPPQKREWKIETHGNEIRLVSKTTDPGVQDEFDLRMRLVRDMNWILSSDFKYSKSILENQTRYDLQMQWDLLQVAEFRVNATYPVYTGDESSVVRFWPKKQLSWTFWNETLNDTDSDIWHRAWETTSYNDDGDLTIRIHVDQLIANGTHAKFLPNSIKYDIEFDNWKWHGPPNSRLALVSKISSQTSSTGVPGCDGECIFKGDRISFNDSNGYPLGVFGWDKNVKADDINTPVVAYYKNDSDDQSQSANLFFTFMTAAHPSSIHWDPFQGLDYPVSPDNLSGAMKIIIVFTVVIVFLVMFAAIYILARRYSVHDYNVIN